MTGGQPRADPDAEGLPDRPAWGCARHRLQHVPDVERLPRHLRLARHRQRRRRQAAPACRAAARDLGRGRADGARGGRIRPGPRAARRRGRRAGPRQEPWPSATRWRSSTTPAARPSAPGSRSRGSPRQARLHREGWPQLDRRRLDRQPQGMLGNLAFSLTLYSGQMCTAPQNLYVPEAASTPTRGICPSTSSASGLPGPSAGSPATTPRPSSCSGPRSTTRFATTPSRSPRSPRTRWSRRARLPSHHPPGVGRRVVRAPGLVAVDVAREDVYTQECFGPVGFLIRTASTEQSLAQLADTVHEHGAMTAAVYSTSDAVLDAARDAAAAEGELPCPRTSPARSSSTRRQPSPTFTAPAPTLPRTPPTPTPPSSRTDSASSRRADTSEPGWSLLPPSSTGRPSSARSFEPSWGRRSSAGSGWPAASPSEHCSPRTSAAPRPSRASARPRRFSAPPC